jgi:nicotinamide-nucleotide amidase
VILVNGGLGPTSDDLSAEAAALALGEDLQEDTQWRQHLQDWYREQGREFPKSNLKQCLLPTSAVRIDNPKGTAPGFRIKLNQAWLFFTPGVPVEFKTMVEEQFIPFLQQEFTSTQSTRLHKLLTLGHGESVLADKLTALTIPPNITLGYRPSAPHVEIKVFARGEQAIGQLNDFVDAIKSLLGIAIVTENCPSIAQCVHELLLQNHCTLSLAESCTGGMLSSQMVEFAGSSNYLHQSLVTYSNQSKQQILGIPEASLAEHGSVSLETAIAMAESVRGLANSDYALAISGIAGPDGGSEEKPVGTVCLAIADRKGSRAQMIHLPYRSRNLVRVLSCAVALDMLRRTLLNQEPIVPYSSIPASKTI